MKNSSRSKFIVRALRILALSATILAATISAAVQTQEALPSVISADTLVYPIQARQFGIEGVVQLRVTTDGKQATQVVVESGSAMLGLAAQLNIRTWRFQEHLPTSFETTFRFALLDSKFDCSPEPQPDDGKVSLRLPSEVEITAKGLRRCDPVVDFTRPSVVNIEVHLNGKVVSPPTHVTLIVAGHSFQAATEDGKFVAPPEVLQAQKVEFVTQVAGSRIRTETHGSMFTAEFWTLILEDKHFSKEYRTANELGEVRSTCVLKFSGEPGRIQTATDCRSKIKK